ncbi:MAG TPA: beta-ketoacyl synthase N-terminal-like domain-containing protein [Acidobacteriaceae bacterium]
MTMQPPAITGFGSVSPFGPLAGLIPPRVLEPSPITAWETSGLRRAFLVEPFQPAAIVPGLKTRRLDRLSAWAMVASSLALQDAGIDLTQLDRTRVAVVFATGFGCVELTEAFYQSAAVNGWSGTDPITFPETLANAPASHVALFHGLQGPNLTIGCKSFATECALLHAASLLRHNQADLALVLSGDTLTQAVYEWYEAAHLLSPACFHDVPLSATRGFVPSEGVVACVLQPSGSSTSRSYASLLDGRWANGGTPHRSIQQMLGSSIPNLTICAGSGAPCITGSAACMAREFTNPAAAILAAQPVAAGLADSGGLFHLILALSSNPPKGKALMLATSGDSGFATLLLELQ